MYEHLRGKRLALPLCEPRRRHLKNLSFTIEHGQWTAIVGHNGSGKSTLARILNGLQLPTEGEVTVQGIKLTEESIWDIRRQVGMVFQNPDNQFVGSTVEDDVAFGLENIGVPRTEMVSRVEEGIRKVGMESFNPRATSALRWTKTTGRHRRFNCSKTIYHYPR